MTTINESDIRELVKQIIEQSASASCQTAAVSSPVPVEVSARHVHLTEEAAQALFGKSALTQKRALSQPGEFLSEERVKIVTEHGEFSNVAVLGPTRSAVQVELSATDCRSLGIQAPVNLSGNLTGASDVILIGPKGIWDAKKSAIIAKAHIHMTPGDAEKYRVKNGQTVQVRLHSRRPITLEDVTVRVSDKYTLAMHIDFDEANACLADKNTTGTLSCAALSCRTHSSAVSPAPVKPESSDATVHISGKKLITEADAKEIINTPGDIHIDTGILITPAAKDVFSSHHRKVIIN